MEWINQNTPIYIDLGQFTPTHGKPSNHFSGWVHHPVGLWRRLDKTKLEAKIRVNTDVQKKEFSTQAKNISWKNYT
jgi:hypothetical protein